MKKALKYFRFLLILPLLAFGPFFPGSKTSVTIDTSLIGMPIENGTENVSFSLTNKLNTQARYNLLFAYKVSKDTTNLIYASQFLTYSGGQSRSFKCHVDHRYMPTPYVDYLIIIRNDQNQDILKFNQRIYDKKPANKIITVEDSSYLSKTYAFKISNNNKYTYRDSFQFNNMPETFYQDEYLYLPLKDLHFYYKGLEELNYKNIYLTFIDSENLFPDCQINSDKLVRLELYASNLGATYYLFLKNDLYVHPNLLTMSFIKQPGYMKTSKFYLPHNKQKEIQKYRFSFEFIEMGLTKSTFTYSLGYICDHNFVGECYNSDFCVISGVANG